MRAGAGRTRTSNQPIMGKMFTGRISRSTRASDAEHNRLRMPHRTRYGAPPARLAAYSRDILLGGLRPLGRTFVQAAHGDRGEQLVGMLFFRQRLIEEVRCFFLAEELCPFAQGSIARDLMVLGCLRGSQDPGVGRINWSASTQSPAAAERALPSPRSTYAKSDTFSTLNRPTARPSSSLSVALSCPP